MSTATLTYDLTDADDCRSHQEAIRVSDIIMAIYDFDQWLRDQVKYNPENITEERLDAMDKVRDKLHEFCSDSGVSNLIFE